jgi:hypothetical protein
MRRKVSPWKGIYGIDRGYSGRVDRAQARGQLTLPGTAPNAPNGEKIRRKRNARKAN